MPNDKDKTKDKTKDTKTKAKTKAKPQDSNTEFDKLFEDRDQFGRLKSTLGDGTTKKSK